MEVFWSISLEMSFFMALIGALLKLSFLFLAVVSILRDLEMSAGNNYRNYPQENVFPFLSLS